MSDLKKTSKKTTPKAPKKSVLQKKKTDVSKPNNDILMLQKRVGNQATQQLLHSIEIEKKVRETDDKKEENSIKKTGNLPNDIQEKMESSFNADFSTVKIYINSTEAKKLNALAFTQGEEIHFASGKFNPNSAKGQEIIGHELSHVLQQRQGVVNGTHTENNYTVNNEKSLEAQANREGKKAAKGELINPNKKLLKRNQNHQFTQKKSQTIQLWRDIPGQARIESTAPSTEQAWNVFQTAARRARGGHASSAMPELRRYYYNIISQRMRGSFAPINIDAHTTNGFNHHWQGTITFVFGDTETSLQGGGVGSSSLSNASNSSNTLESANSNATSSSGSASGTFTPGDGGGAGGNVTVGGSGTTTNSNKDTQGDSQNSSSTSTVRQQLNRFSSTIGIRVSINGSYDMGSSWTDWINPATYGASIASSVTNSNGSAVGACGTVIYYRGAGIAPTP